MIVSGIARLVSAMHERGVDAISKVLCRGDDREGMGMVWYAMSWRGVVAVVVVYRVFLLRSPDSGISGLV